MFNRLNTVKQYSIQVKFKIYVSRTFLDLQNLRKQFIYINLIDSLHAIYCSDVKAHATNEIKCGYDLDFSRQVQTCWKKHFFCFFFIFFNIPHV